MSKLADLIHGASKSREAAEMAEIVGDGTLGAGGSGKFSRACGEAQRTTAGRELSLAQEELIANPRIVDDGGALSSFRVRHAAVSHDVLNDLINKAYAVLHPPANYDNAPAAEPGEIARRSRAY